MEARLASETDFAGFREAARMLLARQVPPETVQWEAAPGLVGECFSSPGNVAQQGHQGVAKAASAIVPASFMRLCQIVLLHHDPQRFALLYRLLWRLVHEPGLRGDPIDPDMLHAHQMGQAVRREIHKMKALLRFRPVQGSASETLHLAWSEPAHHILEAIAPWFATRSPQMHWAIFTPERSVEWDTHQLHFAGGLARAQAPGPESGDREWIACYERVFGPARKTEIPQEDTAA